ncbi:MAG: RluA family pseudouridine synthase [Clostridia bacterium]
MKKIEFKTTQDELLSKAISRAMPKLSFGDIRRMLENKDVKINGERVKVDGEIFAGDEVTFFFDESKLKSKSYYDLIFEDENVLIVNKKVGIEVCDGDKNLLEILRDEKKSEVYAVHRLDRNTEGLLVFAKNLQSKSILDAANKSKGLIEKIYMAEVVGVCKFCGEEKIAYLVKDSETSSVKVFANKAVGSEMIATSFKTLKTSGGTSILEIGLKTGKTHQIRAHLAYLGFPIVGDGKYGKNADNKKFNSKTQKLSATKLSFHFEKSSPLAYLNSKQFEAAPSWLFGIKI